MENHLKPALAVLLAAQALITQVAWGHGEETLGPHGGFIRMPGAFHTELKPESSNRIAIYLLDLQFENPTNKDSSVSVDLKRGTTTQAISCERAKLSFICTLPGMKLKAGDQVIVRATRKSAVGAPVVYTYPFKPMNAGH